MNQRSFVIGLTLFQSVICVACGFAMEPSDANLTLALLLSEDATQRERAWEQLSRENIDMASKLSAIVRNPEYHIHNRDSVAKAISVLGTSRAVGGIDALVGHIGFPFVKHPQAPDYPLPVGRPGVPLEQLLPAVSALINIGEPCIDAVIAKLSTTDSILERKACTAVLMKLNRQTTIRAKLRSAIANASPRHQSGLKKALVALADEPTTAKTD